MTELALKIAPPTHGDAAASSMFDLDGACSVLRAWLRAADDENLDCSTAQVSLRAAEEMLNGWEESPAGRMAGDPGLWTMYGVNLVTLAEASMWVAACASSKTMAGPEDATLVRRALDYLQRAAELAQADPSAA